MLSKIMICWVALAIALTGATQLRIGRLPVGPGEVLIALWMAFFAFCLIRNVPFSYSRAFRPFAIFWSIAATLLAAGSVVAIVLNRYDGQGASHDALAFALVGPLTCMLAIRLGDTTNDQYYLTLARVTLLSISGLGFLLLAASVVTSTLGPISLWYGGGARFRGWAENPNQLAMFMHPTPFLGWYLLQRAQGFGRKLVYLLAMGVCLAVGLATDSDALKVGWIGGAGVVALWAWCRLLIQGRGEFLQVAIAYFLVPAVVLAFALGLGSEIVSGLQEIVDQVYEKGDRGHIGLVLLMNGLEAISHSPLVGWGPGAFSGHEAPFESREAHNTLVDWGMSTGGLGMLLYLGLLLWCAIRAIRSGSPWLLGALPAMLADSAFGYSLRQPFFWLVLVLISALPGSTVRWPASARLPEKGKMAAPEQPAHAAAMRRSRRKPQALATRMP